MKFLYYFFGYLYSQRIQFSNIDGSGEKFPVMVEKMNNIKSFNDGVTEYSLVQIISIFAQIMILAFVGFRFRKLSFTPGRIRNI